MLRFILFGTLVALAAPSEPQRDHASYCAALASGQAPDHYPAHHLSPEQSLDAFDAVFLGEVVVPIKKCSLGYCAGLRVLRRIKGEPDRTLLMRVVPTEVRCQPQRFEVKGQRWVVFADSGTTPKGLQYFQTREDSPTFRNPHVPNFARLEAAYQLQQARMDALIEQRMSQGVLR